MSISIFLNITIVVFFFLGRRKNMSVFRVEKTKDFTIMSNHHLKNKSLTLKSKGLLSLMLSLPEEWDYNLMKPKDYLFSLFSSIFITIY